MPIITPTLPNGNPIKDRIVLFGPPKIGKTHQLFQIAWWHQQAGSDAIFYGINNDTSWEVVYANPQFQDLTNIEFEDVNTFQDHINLVRRYHKKLRDQDWLCLDLAERAWTATQDEYAQRLAIENGSTIEDVGDLWTVDDAPRDDEGKPKYPIGGWDWGMCNARYNVLSNNYLMRGPGHRMIISGQAKLIEGTDRMRSGQDDIAKKTQDMFKHLGVKPAGNKHDPFRYHTILHIDGDEKHHTQKMSTAGERWGNREWLGKRHKGGQVTDEPITDFFHDYLVRCAGWQLV